MNMNNIMLDLETMGNNSYAAIVAIGAVRFDDNIKDSFYEIVKLESSIDLGMKMDASTIMWWLEQCDSARSELTKDGALTISGALIKFAKWIGDDAVVWGNGATFDNVILTNAYKLATYPRPWKFRNDACYRTIKNLNKDVMLSRIGTHHNALDDAKSQAEHLIDIWKHNENN